MARLPIWDDGANSGRSGDSSIRRPPRAQLPDVLLVLYNLSLSRKPMILLASLSKECGRLRVVPRRRQPAPARDTNDPDYQIILEAIRAAKRVRSRPGGLPRFPPRRLPCPLDELLWRFVRKLRPSHRPDRPYETDQAYWRSLWYHPPAVRTASVNAKIVRQSERRRELQHNTLSHQRDSGTSLFSVVPNPVFILSVGGCRIKRTTKSTIDAGSFSECGWWPTPGLWMTASGRPTACSVLPGWRYSPRPTTSSASPTTCSSGFCAARGSRL